LYITLTSGNAVDSLQSLLNTDVKHWLLAECLTAALGKNGAAKGKVHPSILILDEVNSADDGGSSGVKNKDFVVNLMQKVAADDNIICIIITKNEDTANHFVTLNGGKIRPYPGFYKHGWEPYTDPEWKSFSWTQVELRSLLEKMHQTYLSKNSVDLDSLVSDGMTPADAVTAMTDWIRQHAPTQSLFDGD
jgi:hypothetical protein